MYDLRGLLARRSCLAAFAGGASWGLDLLAGWGQMCGGMSSAWSATHPQASHLLVGQSRCVTGCGTRGGQIGDVFVVVLVQVFIEKRKVG